MEDMLDPVATSTEPFDRIVGEEVATPPWKGQKYLPVALESLIPGTVLGFRVFIQVDGSHVLIHGREAPFAASDRERLFFLQQPTVYVHVDEAERYLTYLEENLTQLVDQQQISDPIKANLVYHAAQGLMRDILLRPEDPRVLVRAQRAADVTVGYILKGRDSFAHLLSSCDIDYKTYTHSVHVCIFTVALARRVGFPVESLHEIGTAVLLHDIGKTRIDPAILNKPGPLSLEERDLIRRHPAWGLDLVRDRTGLTPTMADVILHHHEKLDGSGYPDGLKGNEISHVVRIVTICDIFDAVTTNRAYKRALSTFDTLALMQREMRDQLDVDLLVELVRLLRRPG